MLLVPVSSPLHCATRMLNTLSVLLVSGSSLSSSALLVVSIWWRHDNLLTSTAISNDVMIGCRWRLAHDVLLPVSSSAIYTLDMIMNIVTDGDVSSVVMKDLRLEDKDLWSKDRDLYIGSRGQHHWTYGTWTKYEGNDRYKTYVETLESRRLQWLVMYTE